MKTDLVDAELEKIYKNYVCRELLLMKMMDDIGEDRRGWRGLKGEYKDMVCLVNIF